MILDRCPVCKTPFQGKEIVCSNCGTRVDRNGRRCLKCGEWNSGDARRCIFCGRDFTYRIPDFSVMDAFPYELTKEDYSLFNRYFAARNRKMNQVLRVVFPVAFVIAFLVDFFMGKPGGALFWNAVICSMIVAVYEIFYPYIRDFFVGIMSYTFIASYNDKGAIKLNWDELVDFRDGYEAALHYGEIEMLCITRDALYIMYDEKGGFILPDRCIKSRQMKLDIIHYLQEKMDIASAETSDQ